MLFRNDVNLTSTPTMHQQTDTTIQMIILIRMIANRKSIEAHIYPYAFDNDL